MEVVLQVQVDLQDPLDPRAHQDPPELLLVQAVRQEAVDHQDPREAVDPRVTADRPDPPEVVVHREAVDPPGLPEVADLLVVLAQVDRPD